MKKKVRELSFRLRQTARLLERQEAVNLSLAAQVCDWRQAAKQAEALAEQYRKLLLLAHARIEFQAAALATAAERN